MRTALVQLMYERHPSLNNADISNYAESLLQKRAQGDVAQKLGMDRYLLTNTAQPVPISYAEDTLEAFFGALFEIGNWAQPDLPSNNDGAALARIVTCRLYGQEDYQSGAKSKDSKGQVKEIFEKLGFSDTLDIILKISKAGGRKHYAVGVNPQNGDESSFYNQLYEKFGERIEQFGRLPHNWGEYTADPFDSDDIAQIKVFNQALATLAKSGITWNWAQSIKDKEIRQQMETDGKMNTLHQILKNDGYDPDWYDFQSSDWYAPNKTRYILHQFIARRPDGVKEIVYGQLFSRRDYNYRVVLIENILANNRY